jgi:FkbM family methyltransferase
MTQWLRDRLRQVGPISFAVHQYRSFRRRHGIAPAMTPYGFRLAGNAQMLAGTFEVDEVAILGAMIAAADRFIDVGANIGLYTCLARSRGKPAVAFEPLPDNLAVLFANLAANGWQDTEVLPVGLAERPGLATLHGADTGASLTEGWAGAVSHPFLRHTIALNTLDNLLGDRFAGERLAIKVDIEGAEHAMLLGATRTLERVPRPAWLVEIGLSEHRPDGFNARFADTFECFFSRGYVATTADAAARPVTREDVARWMRTRRLDFGGHNFVFRGDA